jgi:hypothetical protein
LESTHPELHESVLSILLAEVHAQVDVHKKEEIILLRRNCLGYIYLCLLLNYLLLIECRDLDDDWRLHQRLYDVIGIDMEEDEQFNLMGY